MRFSSDAILSVTKNKLKLFLDLESDLEKTYQLNSQLQGSPSQKKHMRQFKIQIPLGLTIILGVSIRNRVRLELFFPSSISLVPKLSHIGITLRARVSNETTRTRASSYSRLVPQSSATNAKVINTQLPVVLASSKSP